jgi:hypothetical protein
MQEGNAGELFATAYFQTIDEAQAWLISEKAFA